MKYLITSALILWGLFFYTNAKANDYNTITIGHIITETIKGTDIDYGNIGNSHIQKNIHELNLDFIDEFFEILNLPRILDGFNTQLRLSEDKRYKCSLQGDYKNKECN